ncbi:MAG: glycosyltransferase family 2 protein [Candidatus Omnitrophota bacterium]
MDRCDIIIPVWNQRAFTRDCVDSIIKNTDGNYRLIIIDNASDEETRGYLDGLKEMKSPPVLVLRNDKNVGFVKAVNQGIRASDAPYVCLLNNDTITTKDWLKSMIDIASIKNDIGIVNPSSNNLGQKPADGQPFELYAASLAAEAGKFVELGAAIGFCMLIKREVIEKIGLFDEIYGMGNFEDTDFSKRAVKEGYRCVRACGAYVYHRESSSFGKVKTFEEDFKRNREIYEFRWGKPRRIAYVLDSYDDNVLKRLSSDTLKLARGGNWVSFFLKEKLPLPEHSNIKTVELPGKHFYLNTLFNILKKKKKFDEIFVSEEKFGKVLERLTFIHCARVKYY